MSISLLVPAASAQDGLAEQATPQTLASRSGLALETEIETLFRTHGIEIIRAADWREARAYETPDLSLVVLDAPYVSIYGHRSKIEFLLFHKGRQILIEAKRQNTSGSTDEKLPYVFQNALANIEQGREFVLVMDGDGWKQGAVDWIASQAAETEHFTVQSLPEFATWLEALLRP